MPKHQTHCFLGVLSLYGFITFTYFQVHRIFDIFYKLLTSTRLLINKPLQVQHENRREFFQSHPSTYLDLGTKRTAAAIASCHTAGAPQQRSSSFPRSRGPQELRTLFLGKCTDPINTAAEDPLGPSPAVTSRLRTSALWH